MSHPRLEAILIPFAYIFLSLSLTHAYAGEKFEECAYDDMQKLQTKSFDDLEKDMITIKEKVLLRPKTKSMKKVELGLMDCGSLFDMTLDKYRSFGDLLYIQYREYLNNFLDEATASTPDTRGFKRLAEYFRDKEGGKLITAHAEAWKNKKASDPKDTNYTKLSQTAEKAEQDIAAFMKKSYKTLRISLDKLKNNKPELIPITNHNCKSWDHQEFLEPLSIEHRLVSTTPQIKIDNVCTSNENSRIEYPTEQKVIHFQFSEGRAMFWYCHQSIQIKKVAGNYFKTFKSQASCLAYDLLNNRPMLGDHKQHHVAKGAIRRITVTERRLQLAKNLGKIPMTYEEFVKNNPKLHPPDPSVFLNKIPKECHDWGGFKSCREMSLEAIWQGEKRSSDQKLEL